MHTHKTTPAISPEALAAALNAYGVLRLGDADAALRAGLVSFADDGALELTDLGHFVAEVAEGRPVVA